MTHTHVTDELREEILLYVFGMLEAEQARVMAKHIDAGCTVCREEARSLSETAARIPEVLEAAPGPGLKKRVMDSVRRDKRNIEQPLPGVFVQRGEFAAFKPTPFPGISQRVLYSDPITQCFTVLLKLEPGARYPAHRHAEVEQCLVLEGTVRIGEIQMSSGDFEWALGGTNHDTVETDTGCLLLIMASRRDELLA